jgi:DNA polymerase III subunit epsilon
MREIVLDTETTGLDPFDKPAHRIVEIGAVELWNQVPTGQTYHQYIHPERDMPAEAFAVHGISEAFLADKPRFADIAQGFLAFIGDARLIIHNASFDMRFLNAELSWVGLPALQDDRALDTLMIARRRFPGSPASLDALCRRFGIDNSNRTLHGALLDSDFGLGADQTQDRSRSATQAWRPQPRPTPLPQRLTDTERAAHAAMIAELGEGALWNKRG